MVIHSAHPVWWAEWKHKRWVKMEKFTSQKFYTPTRSDVGDKSHLWSRFSFLSLHLYFWASCHHLAQPDWLNCMWKRRPRALVGSLYMGWTRSVPAVGPLGISFIRSWNIFHCFTLREKLEKNKGFPSQVLEPGLNDHYWLIGRRGYFLKPCFLYKELLHSKKDASTPELKDSEEWEQKWFQEEERESKCPSPWRF